MKRINRDALIALVLLVFTGAMWGATYAIPDRGYQTMGSAVWPRIVLVGLLLMSLIYLIGALRGKIDDSAGAARDGSGPAGWYRHYRNPLWCFLLFFLFLVTMPVFGMLIGGILFVFLALTTLGETTPRAVMLHAAVAIVSVGAMWAVFTFWLEVFLPEGMILGSF